MIETISKNLVNLKQEFRRVYCGTSHVQEIMPLNESDDFDESTLEAIRNGTYKSFVFFKFTGVLHHPPK